MNLIQENINTDTIIDIIMYSHKQKTTQQEKLGQSWDTKPSTIYMCGQKIHTLL